MGCARLTGFAAHRDDVCAAADHTEPAAEAKQFKQAVSVKYALETSASYILKSLYEPACTYAPARLGSVGCIVISATFGTCLVWTELPFAQPLLMYFGR